MREQRQEDCRGNRQLQQYYSAKVDLMEKQETKSVARGRIVRNQAGRGSKEASWDGVEKKKAISLTPQHTKFDQNKRKKSEVQQGFSLGDSHANSKYLTIKKDSKENGSERTKKGDHVNNSKREPILIEHQESKKESGNGTIKLNQGWTYKGQYSLGLFHGFGELIHLNQVIYKGKFQCGYFHGYGKLQNCPMFNYLINIEHTSSLIDNLSKRYSPAHNKAATWTTYIGQFKRGETSGFGQLWLNQVHLLAKWQKGKVVGKAMLCENN